MSKSPQQSSTQFVHLRLHSEYSLSDGIIRIPQLAGRVRELGMPAVAITDQFNLFAMVKFYRAAMSAGIKPIIGVDLLIDESAQEQPPSRITLLCQNEIGYAHMTRLVTRAYTEGQQSASPLIQREWLQGASEGLIALSCAQEGDVGRALLNGDTDQAAHCLSTWRNCFGDSFYLELQRCGRPEDEAHIAAALTLAVETQTAVVATSNARFLYTEEFDAHEVRVCIHDGYRLDDPRRPKRYTPQQYLKSPAEMAEAFADIPEALENTVEIAKRCNLSLTLGENYLPDFPVPGDRPVEDYLREQSVIGLDRRLEQEAIQSPETVKTYRDRLDLELGVINGMGFPGYFLIVADFIAWARDHGVPVGPGRGSGAGSLVAWALGITDINPITYDLLFERFLNPERVSMPDFDIDFCMDGRDRVIDYVAERYGSEKVSQIITYGSMAARAVVRDVGRVMGHPYGFVDRMAKLIPGGPQNLGITLEQAITGRDKGELADAKAQGMDLAELIRTSDAELATEYREDESVAAVLDMAMTLEGLARNAGKHAGGVVIAPRALTDFTPLYCEPDGGHPVTQFDKDDVEAVGLVKFDFLGLRTLTIIDRALKLVNEDRIANKQPIIDMRDAPLDDKPSFDLLKRGATTAVFQLESSGMRKIIKDLQPDSFEDIVALVALYRPGPLQSGMVADFISRKQGKQKIIYPHPSLEPILKPTYGIILYQEQVMQIAQVLSGYTLGGADMLRRAMGKKKADVMAQERSTFVEGAEANGVDPKLAGEIFDLIEKFAGYGFNKSHSAAYALVSYHTAWLKAHYPAAFMCAVLGADMDHTDKVVTMIDECSRMGITLRPPDVNAYDFTVLDEKTIQYGLGAIKGVGRAAIEIIQIERENNGIYPDLFDLCRRIDSRKVNRRVLEALIKAGALDSMGQHRAAMVEDLGRALSAAEQQLAAQTVGQGDMFGMAQAAEVPRPANGPSEVAEWPELVRLGYEKDTLGLYLTGHPYSGFEAELKQLTSGRIAELLSNAASNPDASGDGAPGRRRSRGQEVTVAGLAVDIARFGSRTKLVLDDRSGRVECTLFENTSRAAERYLDKDNILLVKGKLGYDDYADGFRITVDEVFDLEAVREKYATRVLLRLSDAQKVDMGALENSLVEYRDNQGCPVSLKYVNQQALAWYHLDENQWRVRPCEGLVQELQRVLGPKTVRFGYRGERTEQQTEPQASVG
ncbi:MAG: DNA polymerase III subunit alpha [Nevskiales bacterium]